MEKLKQTKLGVAQIIQLSEDVWMTFNRAYYDNDGNTIVVNLIDNYASSVTNIATFSCGRWSFSNNENRSLFWKESKKHPFAFKRMVTRLLTPQTLYISTLSLDRIKRTIRVILSRKLNITN
jgi:hypothetical protein